jgi:hypothetical protein
MEVGHHSLKLAVLFLHIVVRVALLDLEAQQLFTHILGSASLEVQLALEGARIELHQLNLLLELVFQLLIVLVFLKKQVITHLESPALGFPGLGHL